jgi:hypothetical protein
MIMRSGIIVFPVGAGPCACPVFQEDGYPAWEGHRPGINKGHPQGGAPTSTNNACSCNVFSPLCNRKKAVTFTMLEKFKAPRYRGAFEIRKDKSLFYARSLQFFVTFSASSNALLLIYAFFCVNSLRHSLSALHKLVDCPQILP